MRHTTYILSAIATLAVLAGCTKPDTPESASVLPIASQQPIEFGASTPQTKGMPEIYTLERLAAQRFSVSAWYTPDGETFGAGSTHYLANRQFGTLDKTGFSLWQGTTGSGVSEAADPAYYPLDGTLSFFCYAPYRDDVTDASDVNIIPNPDAAITTHLTDYLPGSPLIRFTPKASSSGQIDFIAATPVLDVTRTGSAIPLDFTNHLTTQLRFYVNYIGSMNAEEGAKISQIIIRDVIGSEYLYFTEAAGGTLGFDWCSTISPEDGGAVMPKASYTLAGNALQDVFLKRRDDSTPEKLEESYTFVNYTTNGITYLLPQAIPAGAQLEVTYVIQNTTTELNLDENVVTCSLPATPWPQGRIVRYNITINIPARQVVNITTSIEPWSDAGNSHSPEELMY